VEPQQPVPGEPQPQGEPDDDEEFDEATFTSSLDLTPSGGAKVCRPKSKDVVPLHWSSGLSAVEPGLTANTTTASSVGSSRVPSPLSELEGTAKVEGGSSGREKTNGNMRATTIHMNGHGHAAQTNGRVGGGVNGWVHFLPLRLGYCVVSGTSNSPIWATNSESGYWFPQGPSSLKFSTNPAISVPTAPSSLEFSPNLAIHVPTPSKSGYC